MIAHQSRLWVLLGMYNKNNGFKFTLSIDVVLITDWQGSVR